MEVEEPESRAQLPSGPPAVWIVGDCAVVQPAKVPEAKSQFAAGVPTSTGEVEKSKLAEGVPAA